MREGKFQKKILKKVTPKWRWNIFMDDTYVKQIFSEDPIYQPTCTGYQTLLLQLQIVWMPISISMTLSQVSRLEHMDLFCGGPLSTYWHLANVWKACKVLTGLELPQLTIIQGKIAQAGWDGSWNGVERHSWGLGMQWSDLWNEGLSLECRSENQAHQHRTLFIGNGENVMLSSRIKRMKRRHPNN